MPHPFLRHFIRVLTIFLVLFRWHEENVLRKKKYSCLHAISFFFHDNSHRMCSFILWTIRKSMNFDVVFSHLLPSSCFVLLKWPKWRSCFTCLSENRIMFAHNFKAEQFYFFNSNAWLSHTKERCIQEEYCVCNFNICFYGFSCKCSTAAKDEIRDFFFFLFCFRSVRTNVQ